jgi:hypothetical protein
VGPLVGPKVSPDVGPLVGPKVEPLAVVGVSSCSNNCRPGRQSEASKVVVVAVG